ncbi:L-serine ammonia-lyase, iron-sulfur-dependent, subunit alpha [Clostridium sp.]|uniref:L-cysteine desulfidase family protein n=1 Tax=Clostridium sp. TaxID=1506 RepID=UPI002FC9C893
MSILNNEELIEKLLNVVKRETKPAIGCTEPVAVALTVATAKKYFTGEIKKIDLKVSKSILKNGKSVTIPNTEECGIHIAAALGEICGDADAGLLVFRDVQENHINQAKRMVEDNIINVGISSDANPVFVQADICGEKDQVTVILKGSHTNIVEILVNTNVVYKKESLSNAENNDFLKELTLKDMRNITEEISIDKLDFIMDGINMNMDAAHEGLKKEKGLRWGASLLKLQKDGIIGGDPVTTARILTAAGSDIRMSGGACPIMTSGGSGNQGLCVIIPITVVGENINACEETIKRAVFFGHIVNNYVKKYTGKLSAICGCAIAAGIGAGVGVAWLLGGKDKEIEGTIHNMLANLTGMVCDGAKESCAIKLSTSAAESIIAAYLACNKTIVPIKTGIIGKTVEETIKNLGILCSDGFYNADDVMLSIACE